MQETKKKKILFVMPSLGCGGVESTLFSLFDVIDKEKYDITLLLLEKKGEFLERIPKKIKIREIEIPEKEKGIFFGKKRILFEYIKRGKIWKIPSFLIYNRKYSISEDRTKTAEYLKRISDTVKPLEEHYDLAIDYFGYATFTTFYLAEKVCAKVKVSWLHSILSRFEPGVFEVWYEKMNVIFACSQMVQKDFENIFPAIGCVQPFYNIIFPDRIRELSFQEGGFNDEFQGVRILTVGRICYEKGMDMAVEVYRKLIAEGYSVRWYLAGNGSKEECNKIDSLLKTEQEKRNFIFLGVQKNPYVYMRQCDIYVQPSRFEGYCTTTNEARIIGCPIVMTDVSGAREQLVDGESGFVVESDVESIYHAVKELIEKTEIRGRFVENLRKIDCDTRKEIYKIYDLLGEQSCGK